MTMDDVITKITKPVILSMKATKIPTKSVPVKSIVYNDIGDQVFTVTTDQAINLYQTDENALVTRIDCASEGINSVIWGPHPDILICAPNKAYDVRYFSLYDNAIIRSFSGHTDVVTSMMMCSDGNGLMTCSKDKTVKLWDMRQNLCTATIECSSIPVASYDNEGLVMAIGVDDTTIKLFDLNALSEAFQIFDLHTYENVHFRGLKFSPDGNEIVISTNSTHTYLLDSFNAQHIHDLSSVANGPKFAPLGDFTNDEQFYLIGGFDGKISMFDTKSGTVVDRISTPHIFPVTHVAFNPTHIEMLSAGSDGTLYSWAPV